MNASAATTPEQPLSQIKLLRPTTGIAIDGGGIKGLMVARALQDLERALGPHPLIENDSIKVLAGTSTGAILSAGIAIGLTAEKLTELYLQFAQQIFPPWMEHLPPWLRDIVKNLMSLIRPARFSNESFRRILTPFLGKMTLKDVDDRLGKQGKTLIITAVDINERRTRFLKSSDTRDHHWSLIDAVMASAAAPTVLPVIKYKLPDYPNIHYFTDGGVGSYANPAYVAAREMVEFQGRSPSDCTLLSFGTGWVKKASYEKLQMGKPDQWRIIAWANNVIALMLADAGRAQSIDIYNDFIRGQSGGGLDFRRFQLPLSEDIQLDDASGVSLKRLLDFGIDLGGRVLADRFPLLSAEPESFLASDADLDPEEITIAIARYLKASGVTFKNEKR